MNPDLALLERIFAGEVSLPAEFDSSPMARALGMSVTRIDQERGDAETAFLPDDIFIQGAGVIQGGAVAAMLDFAMILSVVAVAPGGAIPATTNLDTVFFKPARPGRFLARSCIKQRSRSVIFAQASLFDEEKAEIASATATVLIKSPQVGAPK